MAKGISLHVGINKVSTAFPRAATLLGCENDARAMERIAALRGFEPRELLLGSEATYGRVTTKIRSAAAQLGEGDIFLFTFAGHGFQEADQGEQDEDDFHDETILLFDFELFDDVLRRVLWPCFNPGVRILMIADSCHSETVAMLPHLASASSTPQLAPDRQSRMDTEIHVKTPDGLLARTILAETSRRHLAEYGRFYQDTLLPLFNRPINASVLLLAACRDDETTADGEQNGVFTAALLKVLESSYSPPQDYRDFIEKIGQELANRPQTPVLTPIEPADEAFISQQPFTI